MINIGDIFTFVCLISFVSSQFHNLEPGNSVKTLGSSCKLEKFRVSPQSSILLESANFNTEYDANLKCKNIFVADGQCSLLMQCSDFDLQPQNKNNKCSADFLMTINEDKVKNRYCGTGGLVRGSVNHGKKLVVNFKTNKNNNKYRGFKCRISCCPDQHLSNSQVDLFKNVSRSGEKQQVCEDPSSVSSSSSDGNTCGIKGPVTKIVGGLTAEKYKYTWLAMLVGRIGKKKRQARDSSVIPAGMEAFCGGALVSPRWVVTASHCTLSGSNDDYRVVLGEYDRSLVDDTVVRVHEVEQRVRHPQYNTATYDNDIAMWKLKTPADLSHFRTICLPSPGLRLKNPMTVSGWGVTREGSSNLATVLQEVSVPVVSVSTCERAMGKYDITDNMLCAGGVKGQDACQGDSGGPLMGDHPDSEQTYLAGVVSWGLGCAREGLYGVYTKVSRYEQWIKKNINID